MSEYHQDTIQSLWQISELPPQWKIQGFVMKQEIH